MHRIFPLLARDFYGEQYDHIITPPELISASYSREAINKESKIILAFDQDVKFNNTFKVNGKTQHLKDQFFLRKNSEDPLTFNAVKSLMNHGNKIFIKLKDNTRYNLITYLPGKYYVNTKDIYNGPWIKGSQNNLGALSFDSRTIEIASAETHFAPDSMMTYKTVTDKKGNSSDLKLHFFFPANHYPGRKRPAIVFFFGGGWNGGSPDQFYPHCDYLASRGMVAISAEYRVKSRNNTSPRECVKDGKSAIRWIRQNAANLGIDSYKLAAGGGSAGGQVAAATGTVKGFEEEGEDQSISSRPNALVLFNPVFDNGPDGYGYDRVKNYWREFSPLHNLTENTPPTIVFLGTNDKLIPVSTAEKYKQQMETNGRRCDLHVYDGQGHGFFNSWHKAYYNKTVIEMDRFLASLDYLESEPAIAPDREDAIFTDYDIHEFTFKGRKAKIVFPHKSNQQRNWIWRARFWGHEPQTDLALLERGFHVAYVDVGGLFGNEQAVKIWDDFYAFATEKYQLNHKVVLEGMSRGGLIVYNWANRNADKVAAIYADAPVCDFKSWPMGKWTGTGSETEWQNCLEVYGMTEEEALVFKGNPVDHMENIAKARVPILHVVGNKDEVVPVSENTAELNRRLESLGWTMMVIHKSETGHHPHSLKDPKPIVDFILNNTKNMKREIYGKPE